MFKPEIEIKKFEMVDVITTSSEEEEELSFYPAPCVS